ncbi:sulfur carrier protein ThiS [Lachnobacterium bovis]|uniref:Sulfur carrier protein n=1 Tax=Lachnobacterium bovis TaxID=140626 RepID=A0A1H9R2N5_9FIRM|nr:sulfur carrier protein ThiS [Lachnobacterium bovis]SER66243.1 sulfur carrier protein [Lachnobacterium bovis]
MVTVNGKKYDFADITVTNLLEKLEFNISRVVVEQNEEIISKKDYSKVHILDGDVVEVISFVGGG